MNFQYVKTCTIWPSFVFLICAKIESFIQFYGIWTCIFAHSLKYLHVYISPHIFLRPNGEREIYL